MSGKGYVRTWRCEEDIPELWDDATLFNVYQKLKIIASRPGWTVTSSWSSLAKRLKVAPNTVQKAVAGLEKIGLVRAGKTERGITQLTIVWSDWEPDLTALKEDCSTPSAPKTAAPDLFCGEPPEEEISWPPDVSNFDTEEKGISNFDKQSMSKCDTALNMNKQEVTTGNKTTPPYNPPERLPFGFAEFWLAYPNKKGKKRAIRRWRRGRFSLEEILPVLGRQKRLRDWVKNEARYVPRADAYLLTRGWEDEVPPEEKEEFYILNLVQPKTAREITVRQWLEAMAPQLLKAENEKINAAFEPERQALEEIISFCGGDVKAAQLVMRSGWRNGCNSMRSIRERAPGYLDALRREKKI